MRLTRPYRQPVGPPAGPEGRPVAWRLGAGHFAGPEHEEQMMVKCFINLMTRSYLGSHLVLGIADTLNGVQSSGGASKENNRCHTCNGDS